MLGSQTQTIIGRPILPEAAVHAVVEEHVSCNLFLDYIIFSYSLHKGVCLMSMTFFLWHIRKVWLHLREHTQASPT